MSLRLKLPWLFTPVIPGTRCPLDSSMSPAGGPDLELLPSLWLSQKLWISTQSMTTTGPWTQIWPQTAPQVRVSSKPWVALQETQFCMVMAAAWTWDTTMASGFSPEPWFLHCTMVTGTKNINISLTVVGPWIPNTGSGWHRLGCLHGPRWQLCLPWSSF